MNTNQKRCFAIADVMFTIQSFLEPKDLMALRKTSKTLHKLSMNRVVWLQAAKNVCASEGLSLAWLPLDSMPIGDLEHFSLAPYRFLDFMQRNQNATITPERVQSFTPRNPFAAGPLPISQAFLLPGGRFLLTGSRGVGMCVWDLGYSASRPARATPVAFYPFLLDGLVGDPLPTSDGKGVLLLCDMVVSETQRRLEVFEIYPSSDIPQFTLIASLLTGEVDHWAEGSHYCALHDDHIVVFGTLVGSNPRSEAEMVNVWNFRENTGCKWISHPSNSFTPSRSSLVVFRGSELLVFDFPDMQPLPDGCWTVETTENAPKLILKRRTRAYGSALPLQAHSWNNPSSYVCLVDEPLDEDLDGVALPPVGSVHLELYIMKAMPISVPFDSTLPREIPIYQGASVNFLGPAGEGKWPFHASMMTMWHGQNHLFVRTAPCADPEERMCFTAFPLPPTSTQPVDLAPFTIFYKPPRDPEPDFVLFCPASGRVVTVIGGIDDPMLPPGHTPRIEIHIADCLLPPSCV